MMLIAFFNRAPSQLKILDLGMGWGQWARMAKAFGCEVYGVELCPRKAGYASSHGIRVISLDQIKDHLFDLINFDQFLEHVSDPAGSLSSARDSLKPGGVIKVSTPDGGDIKRRLEVLDWSAPRESRNSLNAVAPLEHINCFNSKSLQRMAMIAGLEPMRMPLSLQYRYRTDLRSIKFFLKSAIYPFYLNFFKKGTYLFFKIDPRERRN